MIRDRRIATLSGAISLLTLKSLGTVIIQSPSSGAPRPVLAEPSLTWFPLADALEESGANLFSLLRWDFRLAATLHGREDDLEKILAWCRGGSNTPTARLITGPGGVGKTRLAATAAETLRREGWSAGFLPASSDLVNMKFGSKGLFLILDYPEEQPERTSAVLHKLAELTTAPYPLRVVFLSRRSFAQWEPEALALRGRFGKQQLAAPGPLSVEQGVALIGEAAGNFAALVGKPVPDLRGARAWLEKSPMHRLPLYATAAAVHAVLSPNEMFGLSGAELVRQLGVSGANVTLAKVFLCHSSGDKTVVRQLYRRLENDGIDPWLDEERILPGQEWETEIRKAVRACDMVVVCLSPTSVSKEGFIQKEIRYALDVADEKPEGDSLHHPGEVKRMQRSRALAQMAMGEPF